MATETAPPRRVHTPPAIRRAAGVGVGVHDGTQCALPCHEAFRQSRACHGTRVRSFCSHSTMSPTRHVVPFWTLAKITYGKTFDKVNTPGE